MNFDEFVKPIIGLPIAHAWRGHGSTVFLELGQLQSGRTRKDGSTGNALGDFTVHVDPNWRVEGKRSILCGSDDSPRAIGKLLQRLIGNQIISLSTYGNLPELEITMSDCSLRTFSAWKGQPGWTINRWKTSLAMFSQFGKIKYEGGT